MFADYVAERIKRCLGYNDPQARIGAIGPVRGHATKDGEPTPRRFIDVSDLDGERYRITVAKI